MKKILLTGHTGFIGSEIKNHYKKIGYSILTLGRSSESDYQIDLRYSKQLEEKSFDPNIEKIIHCAALNETLMNDDILAYYEVNVVATRSLLELARKLNVSEFIYISTFHVYGKDFGDINEKTETHTKNDYGLTHLLSEKIISDFCSWNKLKYKILRPTNVYGLPEKLLNFNRSTLVPFQFIKSAIENSKIIINSNGLQQRNFVSIQDLISSLNLNFEGPLNIYGNETLSIKEYAEMVAQEVFSISGKKIDIQVNGSGNSNGEILKISNTSSIYSPQKSIKPFISQFYTQIAESKKI